MRNERGQFLKGISYSPNTQFKTGCHWRKHQVFRDKSWLIDEYCNKGRSASDIAKQFNVTDSAIVFWLRKNSIPRRSVSEVRKIKHWGAYGKNNPMWGRSGSLNPRWDGGITPERQSFCVSPEWKRAVSAIWKRDNATCQRCGLHRKDSINISFHIHHIKSFKYVKLRTELTNLVLLCGTCHIFVHSKRNTSNEFIQ